MIQYNTPIEVTQTQYKFLMHKYSGILAGRTDAQKFYVKCWMMRYKKFIEQDLNPHTK